MSSTAENNKRIAKNTLLLYVRMLFMMIVSLYTSRVVLNALGVEDYGLYNVIGGVVVMFNLLSGSLSAAISRFITYELGKGDKQRLNLIFSSAMTIQIILILIIVLLAETIGLWFLNTQMNIAEQRMEASNWVFQFSLLAFIINLISIPYNAVIIAHERMSAFAYISIVETIGKLSIAYLILISPIDRLIFYSMLMCAISCIIRYIYGRYSKKHFEECRRYKFSYDKKLLNEMFRFAGWNFIGSSSSLLRDQGINILINLFCGATVNAARGIAIQVNTAITSFINNFMIAVNPQITKSYAENNKDYMNMLIYKSTQYSYYLLLILSLPVFFNTEYILQLWLKTVPEYTVEFVQLILILSMTDCLYRPLLTAHLATGNIKYLQIVVGGINLLNLPISFICLKIGMPPYVTLFIAIFLSLFCLFIRFYLYKKIERFSIGDFFRKVLLNISIVSIVSIILPLFFKPLIYNGFSGFVLLSVICVLSGIGTILLIGLNKDERLFLKNKVKLIIYKVRT
ncbi:lipopolysaccharide biosynthesis protein [Phocaeicola coprophilus]|jgi:O-antigen/teichoic acid export membrane protein|uniref:lipopolysaccharide biosynthesis protein n=1 Tax=Phocaeicola coprophilus TaxID=387090 RepID=UPI00241FDBFF|nr:lipopolysaccharide biosynthesis protein [Phocaeicola coprophilus]